MPAFGHNWFIDFVNYCKFPDSCMILVLMSLSYSAESSEILRKLFEVTELKKKIARVKIWNWLSNVKVCALITSVQYSPPEFWPQTALRAECYGKKPCKDPLKLGGVCFGVGVSPTVIPIGHS